MEGLWIGFAFVLGLAARALGMPPLVGYLAAGFVLNALGVSGGTALAHVAHVGVLLLLFGVGLKVRLRNVLRPEVWATTLVHLAVTAALLAPAVRLVAGLDWRGALLLAVALGFSSTVLAAKVLEEKRELRAFHGRVAIGILVVQDLVAVAVLGVAGASAPSPLAAVLLALPLLRPLLHRLLDLCGHGELMVLFGMLLALAAGGSGFQYLGLSPELGALVLGTLLAEHPRAAELANGMWALREVFLVGFFLQIGMAGLPGPGALLAALLLCALLPLKGGLFFAVLLRFGLRARTGFLSALALATYSEFGLIAVAVASRHGWLAGTWLVPLALAVALSFAIGARANRVAHGLYGRLEASMTPWERRERHPDDEPLSLGASDLVVIGMGRVGSGAYDYLRGHGARVVGLDSDPGKVQRQIAAGRRVLYADAEDPGLWHRLELDGIRAVLLALPDLEAKLIAARHLRARGFHGHVSATNVFPEEAALIIAAGADTTFNYFDLAGGNFAEHTWQALQPRP